MTKTSRQKNNRQPIHAQADINAFFKENGSWERNRGTEQTHLFAAFLDQVISFPNGHFTLLDVGCALGQAAAFFARRYPEAGVSATDISDVAIERCTKTYGELAHFFTADIDHLDGFYDIIYCSNVLEHFFDYKQKTRALANHCSRLLIMVPFNERTRQGRKLQPDPTTLEHQFTFSRSSFNFLLEEGSAESIRSEIISCPGAWGWNRRQKITHTVDNLLRRLFSRPHDHEPLQIIFDISFTADNSDRIT